MDLFGKQQSPQTNSSKNENDFSWPPFLSAHQLSGIGLLFIPDRQGARSCLAADIRYIESQGNFTKVFIHGELKATIANWSLLKFEQIFEKSLSQLFFRVNRKYIINKAHIERYDSNGGYVIMKDQKFFKVPNTKSSKFKKWLGI